MSIEKSTKMKTATLFVVPILLLVSATLCGRETEKEKATVHQKALDIAISRYDIVSRRSDSKIERAIAASVVAELYLQAGDEDNYAKWKREEERVRESAW